jgi:hypothetical protein
MKTRLTLWSLAGFIVACGWVLFFAATAKPVAFGRALWAIVEITAPASLLRHFPLKYYWFILLNALIYSLVGLGTELLRRNSMRHLSS